MPLTGYEHRLRGFVESNQALPNKNPGGPAPGGIHRSSQSTPSRCRHDLIARSLGRWTVVSNRLIALSTAVGLTTRHEKHVGVVVERLGAASGHQPGARAGARMCFDTVRNITFVLDRRVVSAREMAPARDASSVSTCRLQVSGFEEEDDITMSNSVRVVDAEMLSDTHNRHHRLSAPRLARRSGRRRWRSAQSSPTPVRSCLDRARRAPAPTTTPYGVLDGVSGAISNPIGLAWARVPTPPSSMRPLWCVDSSSWLALWRC